MGTYRDLLLNSTSFLLIDWPDREVPDTLARHGFSVVSQDGPGPADYNAYRASAVTVQVSPAGRAPDRVDIVYGHRPLDELPGIIEQARSLNARAVWLQSGQNGLGARDPRGCWMAPQDAIRARQMVEAAELEFVQSPYLPDAVRAMMHP